MPSTPSSPPPDVPGPNRMKAILNSLENLQGNQKRKRTDALDPFLKAARAFPLLHDPFVDIGTVFYDGIRADHGEELPDEDETPEELDCLYHVEVFHDFIKHIPSINVILGSFEDDPAKLENFSNALRNAASLARAKDTCKLKDLCPSFLLDDPSKPGATLDPPIVKGQSKAFMDGIINGEKRPPSFKKLPSCLYDESLSDPKLKCAGFLHSKPLEQTFRTIFTGPLTALDPTSHKGTKHPKGIIHGMTEPSAPAIAYAAIQLIVSLSSAEQWMSEVTGLDLYELYMSIVESLKQTDHPWVKETLDYWTKVAPQLTQTSRRKNGHHATAASDGSDSDDMDGFLDDPPECSPQRPSPLLDHSHGHSSASQRPSPPLDHSRGHSSASQHPSSPPPEQQCQPPPPQCSPQGSHHADEDDDNRLTPPPSTPTPLTPPPVTKHKAPAKGGKATH
ncbi:hypothetical protein BDR05DRAFT_949141 [Suillus weaverae]|nr:hypothetical protein BDR05DRAFT_949141 [Suillus weaverae]